MSEQKNIQHKQKSEHMCADKKATRPSDVKGKIVVEDTRERRDGPGGN